MKLPPEWRPKALAAGIFAGLVAAGLFALLQLPNDTDVEATFSPDPPVRVSGVSVA